jgi:uncharacterized protein YjiK
MRKVTVSIILIISIIYLNCSKQDIDGKANGSPTQSLEPIVIYNLNISEPSGIAYNSVSGLFMIVSDNKSDIFLVDSTGNTKSTISTSSSDMEGITLSQNCDTIYVVEETNQLVVIYLATGIRLTSFPVNVATNPSHSLEGITRNNLNGNLIVLNEKLPCMLLEFSNYAEIWRKEINYTIDISDIFFERSSNNYWIVSHESQKILKLSSDFNLISEWLIPVIQAEGITIVQDKIYIVSDVESKMYVFQKP